MESGCRGAARNLRIDIKIQGDSSADSITSSITQYEAEARTQKRESKQNLMLYAMPALGRVAGVKVNKNDDDEINRNIKYAVIIVRHD